MELTTDQLLAGIPLGILATDLSGKITAANDMLHHLLGMIPGELTGKTLADISAEDSAEADSEALKSLAGGHLPSPYLKELRAAGGSLIPVEAHLGPLSGDEGQVIGAVIALRSLTEEMKLIKDLQRRNLHLLGASEVARVATQILNPQELLNTCVDLIRTRFGFYYAAIFLIDKTGKAAKLRAATGDAGKSLLETGHELEVGSQSMVGWVTANNAARIALDVGQEAIRFDNPLLPKTRSEIALPLRVRGQVIGALDAQSTSVNAFSDEDIQTIQLMADQVAIAIDNARLFSQQQGA